jgi:hypothetical protein
MFSYISLFFTGIFSSVAITYPNFSIINEIISQPSFKQQLVTISHEQMNKIHIHTNSMDRIKCMLKTKAPSLRPEVIEKVITSLDCANKRHVDYKKILTVIDYSLPSNQKRLWVFDLEKYKLLYHTFVAHGIKSGELFTNNFSNKYDSKASSMGVYKTEDAYHGREGVSLRLVGLDGNFNNNASNRYIVIHGGWYMDNKFIKKYGRSGRSWGCPALPLELTKPIIDTIKENSIIVMYYPSDKWFATSRFLNCNNPKAVGLLQAPSIKESPIEKLEKPREYVMFARLNKNDAIVVISANQYIEIFKKTPPLKRMLRRRINADEYIALSDIEIEKLILNSSLENTRAPILDLIQFVMPVIRNSRGYYLTEMHILPHEKIKNIVIDKDLTNHNKNKYNIYFESGTLIRLSITNQFIRWLGL